MTDTKKKTLQRKIFLLKSKMSAHDVDLSWAVAGPLTGGGSYEIKASDWLGFVDACLASLDENELPILEEDDMVSGRPEHTRTDREKEFGIWPILWKDALTIMNQMWGFYAK